MARASGMVVVTHMHALVIAVVTHALAMAVVTHALAMAMVCVTTALTRRGGYLVQERQGCVLGPKRLG